MTRVLYSHIIRRMVNEASEEFAAEARDSVISSDRFSSPLFLSLQAAAEHGEKGKGGDKASATSLIVELFTTAVPVTGYSDIFLSLSLSASSFRAPLAQSSMGPDSNNWLPLIRAIRGRWRGRCDMNERSIPDMKIFKEKN